MKPLQLSILIACLMGAPTPASAAEPGSGPITRAIAREAARLAPDDASSAGTHQSARDWSRVATLTPGTVVFVTLKGETPVRWRFRALDGTHVIVDRSENRPETIPRDDIAKISLRTFQGSKRGAAATASLGAFVGAITALSLGLEVQCQPSCGGVEAMMWLSAVGIPVAAGFGGYRAFGHSVDDVIYRAP